MRIVFFEITEDWEKRFLEQQLAGIPLSFTSESLRDTSTGLADNADVVSVFIRSHVTRAVLDNLPSVRLITTRSTGFDHIDTAACAERAITVSNVPRYGEHTVAEHTFGLILSLSRKLTQARARTRRGDFSLEGLEGFDLRGKTLGVIGAGAIGLRVIRIARAGEMKVLAFDVREDALISDVLGFTYVPLDALLSASDIVSLHAPLLPETRHLMNRERFARMKRGALLINTARGPLVDTDALIRALDDGLLGGAGLDVIEGEEGLAEEHDMFRTPESKARLEEIFRGHELLNRDNVIITPHMAWYSREARQRILRSTVANIHAFAARQPIHVVAGPEKPGDQ